MTETKRDDIVDHRAGLVLSEQMLRQVLHLPDGTRILRVDSTFDPPGIRIIVAHPDIPEVDPYAVAPDLGLLPSIQVKRVEVEEDGLPYLYERVIIDWDFLRDPE